MLIDLVNGVLLLGIFLLSSSVAQKVKPGKVNYDLKDIFQGIAPCTGDYIKVWDEIIEIEPTATSINTSKPGKLPKNIFRTIAAHIYLQILKSNEFQKMKHLEYFIKMLYVLVEGNFEGEKGQTLNTWLKNGPHTLILFTAPEICSIRLKKLLNDVVRWFDDEAVRQSISQSVQISLFGKYDKSISLSGSIESFFKELDMLNNDLAAMRYNGDNSKEDD